MTARGERESKGKKKGVAVDVVVVVQLIPIQIHFSKTKPITGPKPDDLYGKFTWRIEGFSEITKRELRSAVFEVGGYRW